MYAAVGFFAQMVDGALGMAYGTLSTAVLLAAGVPPAATSASVHTAQFFTTGISAISHSYFRNIDKKLLAAVALSGIPGGVIGALILTSLDPDTIKPWIAVYLFLLGCRIFYKVFRRQDSEPKKIVKHDGVFRILLGFFGGMLDAIGSGWGPLMTSSIIIRGHDPRLAIGTVNTAEFFVKTAIALTLIQSIGISFHVVLLGLLMGGIVAAPFGAYAMRFLDTRVLMAGVGITITGLSLFNLYNALF